jgi:hypothetical protein
VVEEVTTLEPGEPAKVEATFDGTDVRLSFGIPRGMDGGDGAPGEVSQVQLDDAIAGTARDPVEIEPFAGTISDPPTQGEVQVLAAWAESLRAALRRQP